MHVHKMKIETRKIQRTGNALTVSLPKFWLKMWSLSKGDHVEVWMEEDGSIRIIPDENTQK